MAGIAKSTFFACVHRGIGAVNKCPELALHFPTGPSEMKEVAIEFQGKSSFGVLDGCVGALDGWLCRIKIPLGKDISNIGFFYSGRYCCYGINVQAVCDSRCRFTYLSCRNPGGTGDSRDFRGTASSYFLQEIPSDFYVLGDSAYTLSSSLLVPFTGSDKEKKRQQCFQLPSVPIMNQNRAVIWFIGK